MAGKPTLLEFVKHRVASCDITGVPRRADDPRQWPLPPPTLEREPTVREETTDGNFVAEPEPGPLTWWCRAAMWLASKLVRPVRRQK